MNSFGKNLKITIFGTSHGKCVGLTIDGLPPGLSLDHNIINRYLLLRQGKKDISTKRIENNDYEILSGYFNNHTTGDPLTIIIKNENIDSSKYKDYGLVRPSHADYTKFIKYNGFNEYYGGGSSSGRLTTPLVILGAICDQILLEKGIIVSSHIKTIKDVSDKYDNSMLTDENLLTLKNSFFPTFDERSCDLMQKAIQKAAKENDGIGGMIETFIKGLPSGIGEPFFDSFESIISHAMFAIPGIKSIEFGDGISLTTEPSSKTIDELSFENDKVNFKSNHQGGINGGITNGNIVQFTTGLRGPSSISKPLSSINLKTKENIIVNTIGRHDSCFVHRALPVVNSLTSFVILDFLLESQHE